MSAGIFISTFQKQIDKHNRVIVPVEFRNVLLKFRSDNTAVGFIAFRSYSHQTIECFSFARMEQLSSQMDTLDPFSHDRDDFSSSVFSDSHTLTFDMNEGRIKLPSTLLEHAKIDKEVCFAGKGATFQIWSPELFKQHQESAREKMLNKWKNSK